MRGGRLSDGIPAVLAEELVTSLAAAPGVRVERIVSRGHASPAGFWYDQDEDELVVVVQGAAGLLVEGEAERRLGAGDWIELPRHVRHRVTWTAPDEPTIWLCVFYRREP